MVNKRQEHIIDILIQSKEWITGKELSNLLNVSDRTIRSDIECINQMYSAPLITSHLRLGYHIIEENTNVISSIQEVEIPTTPNERVIYIIKELLFDKNGLNLTLLQEQMYVSGFSIENDIKKVRKILKSYDGLNLVRRKNYIYLTGEESLKRKLYKDLLVEETQGNFLNINKLAELYHSFDFIKVKDIFMMVLDEYDYAIKETMFPMLMMHIGISIERMLHFNYIKTKRNSVELQESLEYKIAEDFYQRVSNTLNIEIVDDEIALLSLLLLGNRSIDYSNDAVMSHFENNDISQLIDEIFETIKQVFGVDFSRDEDLRIGFITHLQGLVERSRDNQKVDNLFLQDIKKTYPLIFEMGICVTRFLGEKMDIEIGEDEAGFIALHLGLSYERMNINRKYRAILIIPYDQSFATLGQKKIESTFGERLEVVRVLNIFEESKVEDINPDLIITTTPIAHDLSILTIQTSVFINNEDESIIFQALSKLDKKRFQHIFNQKISQLIDPDYFYMDLNKKTSTEVIEFLCDELYEGGIVNENFKAGVLKRESLSPTSFAYSFATPHSFGDDVVTPTISVALLKNPIDWGCFKVKLVILLAINEEDHDTSKMFFDWLSQTISDAGHFSSLLESKNYDDFIKKITKENSK